MLDREAPHAELDAIALVGRDAPLPERLRHDAEHRAAVELLPAGLNGVHAKTPNGERLDKWNKRRCHANESSGSSVAIDEPWHCTPPPATATPAERGRANQLLQLGPRRAATSARVLQHA